MPRKNKYNAVKVKRGGHTFDSEAEYTRWLVLREKEQNGEIEDLQVHPRFNLLPGLAWNGKRYKPAFFTPDFQYTQAGKTVVEDVKGGPTKTTDFTLRLKMWIQTHPEADWDFRIVENVTESRLADLASEMLKGIQ